MLEKVNAGRLTSVSDRFGTGRNHVAHLHIYDVADD